jgi:hypothetical protein
VIGICGSYDGLNLRDEAILTVALEQLRAELPSVEATVLTRDVRFTIGVRETRRILAGTC